MTCKCGGVSVKSNWQRAQDPDNVPIVTTSRMHTINDTHQINISKTKTTIQTHPKPQKPENKSPINICCLFNRVA